MHSEAAKAIAIVGVGAILPDALDAPAFWENIISKRYSISEVPPGRWRVEDYYNPDPRVPDKTYSKIGGWVTGFDFDWRQYRVPPRVAAAMDEAQQWAVTIAAEALTDYGYPQRPLNTENTAVIFGTAMGGEQHYITHQRVAFPEFANALAGTNEFSRLPTASREAILEQWHERIGDMLPPITEDTMPGELPNIIAGRVANMLNLRGPNFITDAACASSFAALKAAIELLVENEVDAVLTGGVDRNMGISPFVKFCKIGALSATGSRPFGDGADGFVMGEGSASFLLKRLEDAERDGDKVYAVIRGVAGSSDGKGKGITAPNPIGQRLAIARAWEVAGLDPATATMIEAHGTSTRVGDVVEVESLTEVFGSAATNSIGLGSVKSNIGHLKAGAGAAGLLKATLALHHKIMPPTLNAEVPNPNIDFARTPFYLLHEAQAWEEQNGTPRRCGVSAYGFGGTNFHIVLEEHIPGALTSRRTVVPVSKPVPRGSSTAAADRPRPFRGIVAIGADTPAALQDRLESLSERVSGGWTPPQELPDAKDIQAPERLVIDFGDHEELVDRLTKARKVMSFDNPQAWEAMEAQGIFRGSGAPEGKIAFMFPGQGSQYVNMGRELMALSPVVAEVFAEADAVMTPILGKPLTDFIFVDPDDSAAVMQAEFDLLQTEITQPAMLAMDMAMMKLLGEFGFAPDMVMGHSLGEYAALIATGALPFADALEAVAARGSEMARVSWDDNGRMAAVLAPLDSVLETLGRVDGYVIPANINSYSQCVIGGASTAVEEACVLFEEQGFRAIRIPVSHAFHTEIVAPASKPLRQVLDRLRFSVPQLPIVANVTGEFYPETVEEIKDMLQVQVAATVQWVKGLETLYAAGVRTFVEVGPKRALRGFAREVLKDRKNVRALLTNHPKMGELPTFNQALCGLYAAGYLGNLSQEAADAYAQESAQSARAPVAVPQARIESDLAASTPSFESLSNMINQAVQEAVSRAMSNPGPDRTVYDHNLPPTGSVVISGTGLGLPGAEKQLMDPNNAMRILRGEQFVDLIPERFRKLMVDKRITRVVKGEDGSGSFYTISDPGEVIKLAGRPGSFDLEEEYGVPGKLVEALDLTSQLAMAAGLDALREAGIPLVQTYRQTTTGKYLPDRWLLPEALRDDTGVIFASAFPGGDRFANELKRFYEWQGRFDQMTALEGLRHHVQEPQALEELNRRIGMLREELEANPYTFDRRFLFHVLSMGHSQFAQYIGARGPNTQVNAACASTTQAVAMAEDWIRNGRCRRVIVIGADAVTSDDLMEWVGAGFLAVGAVTTKDRVDEAALPFDRRRHGTILGMGACALVVESEDALRERGMRGIAEVLSSETSNSAFHGTRLDIEHISMVMERLVTAAERRFGLNRYALTPNMVFMSHETYTPARGGSASAEIVALRNTFGPAAGNIVIANTKGFTGHPMGVGIEDVIAVKILEHGIVPPVPNLQEIDPELGPLNLSRGGRHPVQYALHLAAGFGSQIAMTLTRRIPGGLDRIDNHGVYDHWLASISGYARAQTEVEKRVLRVKDQGAPPNAPAPSTWPYGTGPSQRSVEGASGRADLHLAPAPAPVPVRVDTAPPRINPPERKPVAPKPKAPEPVLEAAPGPRPEEARPEPAKMTPAAEDSVRERIISLVAAQTGYPPDMLDLDLDLEADLGVDTVKQAETFAAIREEFGIAAQEDLSLRDYNTLEKVIAFVKAMRPDLAAPSATPKTAEPPGSPVAAPAPSSAVQAPPAGESIAARILALVSEQTGYPTDMLDLDLDLEADLGVDTVKQAETFAAIREEFGIAAQDDLSLRDYNTLEKVIAFVQEMRPDLNTLAMPLAATEPPGMPQTVAAPEPANVKATSTPPAADTIAAQVLALVSEQTGYPADMLDLDLDLEADLGIDTVKQAETFLAIRETFGIPQQDDLSLRNYNTLEKVITFVREMRPDLDAPGEPPRDMPETPASESAPAPGHDIITNQVLALVATQTGYPEDMLDLDLDLEADLGVDTVKQAETFQAIRETFSIPQQDDLSLRDYNTLEKVITFVREMRPDLAGDSSVQEPLPAESSTPRATETTARTVYTLADADEIPRRIPQPSLRPELSLCKATGVTLDKKSRVVIMPDEGGVADALVARLKRLGVATLQLERDTAVEEMVSQLQGWLNDGPIQGIYWLPALDVEPELAEMDLATWRAQGELRVKKLFMSMRPLYESISAPGTFLVAGTRLGGLHGYGHEGVTAPLGGAVTGFVKTYHVEQRLRSNGQGPLVKAVDFAPSRKTAALADRLLAETLSDPGILEVGIYEDRRYGITLVDSAAADGHPGLALDANTIFLVTGAAGGITSEIVADLALNSRGVFYLLDLVEPPDPTDLLITLCRRDKEALKQHLIEEARAAGERPTPVAIEKMIAAVERKEAALRAIESVEAAGGTAHYIAINLLDSDAVTAVIERIRKEHGRIDVLIHAAGLLIDRTIPDKEPEQFNLVYDVKADGFFNILRAASGVPIAATVAFSSVAGRFGNNGQSDYSAANDLLCKITSSMRRWRPETRAIAIDWTAWGDIGMAARGSVPTVMKALGIDMLSPASGVPTVRRELVAGGFRGEVLVAGALGIMVDDLDETGGLDVSRANEWLAQQDRHFLMTGAISGATLYGGLEVQTKLDPAEQPFLYDHAPDANTPWLPGVMAIESMAQTAMLLAPGYHVTSVDNVEMLGAFKFFHNEPRTLYLNATAMPAENGSLVARVTLRSITPPVREGLPTRIQLHFRADIHLAAKARTTTDIPFSPPDQADLPTTAESIYELFFHGPAYQVLERAVVEGDEALALLPPSLPPDSRPVNAHTIMAPRLIEACFQTAALWNVETRKAMAFPLGAGSVTVYRQPESDGTRLYAIVSTADKGGSFDARVVNEAGQVYVDMRGYRTVSRPDLPA